MYMSECKKKLLLSVCDVWGRVKKFRIDTYKGCINESVPITLLYWVKLRNGT